MAGIGYKLEFVGLEKSLATLAKMDRDIRRNALRNSVRAATAPILREAKALAPTELGFLKKAMTLGVRVYARGTAVAAIIGAKKKHIVVRNGDTVKKINPARYIHLVEKGTRPHTIEVPHWRNPKKTVTLQHPGTPPRPFLRKAFENNRANAIETMRRRLDEEIRKALAR